MLEKKQQILLKFDNEIKENIVALSNFLMHIVRAVALHIAEF